VILVMLKTLTTFILEPGKNNSGCVSGMP